MNSIKEDESLWECLEDLEDTEVSIIYGLVIYNRGDDCEKNTKRRKKVEALLALVSGKED